MFIKQVKQACLDFRSSLIGYKNSKVQQSELCKINEYVLQGLQKRLIQSGAYDTLYEKSLEAGQSAEKPFQFHCKPLDDYILSAGASLSSVVRQLESPQSISSTKRRCLDSEFNIPSPESRHQANDEFMTTQQSENVQVYNEVLQNKFLTATHDSGSSAKPNGSSSLVTGSKRSRSTVLNTAAKTVYNSRSKQRTIYRTPASIQEVNLQSYLDGSVQLPSTTTRTGSDNIR